MKSIPINLKNFIAQSEWTFAKTYADTWPHEYLVKDRVDINLFVKLVEYIRKNGYQGKFYNKEIGYFDYNGKVYWTMGAPVNETTIINRCDKNQTYEYRLKHNDLPDEDK